MSTGGPKVRLQLRNPGGNNCKPAKEAVSRIKSKKKKVKKKKGLTLGNLQLAGEVGPLPLGLVIAGHEPVVQGGPPALNRLKERKK